jgi:2-amino-4-hydroxy-6-hydroxymethyldihydropteridine diphosphokinase
MRRIAIIGIGSNLGDKIYNCEAAIDRLEGCRESRIIRRSSFYKTEPVGYLEQDVFINCVVELETALEPHALLRCLKRLEWALGRRETFAGGPRVIDLDILLYNGQKLKSEDLRIPHPHLHKRAFVLVPLCEIDPNVYHPCLKRTAGELLEALGEIEGVKKV